VNTELAHQHDRFLQKYLCGQADADDIDAFIARWHAAECTGADAHVELHVYLGMTWREYTRWASRRVLPTALEHRQARADATEMTVNGRAVMVLVHPPHRCRRPCPVHWPTDHPLADAPKWWDPLEGIMMRTCMHGVEHPDPDDQQVRLHPQLNRHHCDGCCTAVVLEGDLVAPSPAALDAYRPGRPE
jgi:hypothetical protein